MKKLFIAFLAVITLLSFTACNYQAFDFQYNFNYAYIRLQNGELIEGRVEEWTDYEGEQLQVKVNGVIYLTNSYNCTLIYKEDLEG